MVSLLWGPMLVSMSTHFVDMLKASQGEEKMQKSLLPVQSIKPKRNKDSQRGGTENNVDLD